MLMILEAPFHCVLFIFLNCDMINLKGVDDMNYICIDCGQEFEISPGEANFFRSLGYDLPRRCPSCRRKAKDPRYAEIRDVMRSSPPSRANASGRDISVTGGDVKSIAIEYNSPSVDNLLLSPEENYIAKRHYGNFTDYIFAEYNPKK